MSKQSTSDSGNQTVPKLAFHPDHFRREALSYGSGRLAIRAFVEATRAASGDTVLCPAYIGWSRREGSGVVDPLIAQGVRIDFYRVGADLEPDLEDLERRLKRSNVAGALLIHFFGHVQAAYPEANRLIRDSGAWVLEDCAHAMFSDLVNGATGRLGDASVLSLHKLLPVVSGGALLLNSHGRYARHQFNAPHVPTGFLWDFDLPGIAARRRRNTAILNDLLVPLAGRADPLWPELSGNDVLQTYPVLLRRANRNRVYELMNSRGYGVVSLYHTLVSGITPDEHPMSHMLSRSILNLPVHQDLDEQHLIDLVKHLTAVLDDGSAASDP